MFLPRRSRSHVPDQKHIPSSLHAQAPKVSLASSSTRDRETKAATSRTSQRQRRSRGSSQLQISVHAALGRAGPLQTPSPAHAKAAAALRPSTARVGSSRLPTTEPTTPGGRHLGLGFRQRERERGHINNGLLARRPPPPPRARPRAPTGRKLYRGLRSRRSVFSSMYIHTHST